MSEKKSFPADIRILLASVLVGALVTAGCLAGMAALMVSRGLSGTAAAPLATAAAGLGSFCSGFFAARCHHRRGLLCGTVQGILQALLLLVLTLPYGVLIGNAMLLRFAIAVVCGSVGGFCGVSIGGRKSHV